MNQKTKIAYRAGDQPNNAFSLNVLNPEELAATAGTSGVVYDITDKLIYDPQSRVNPFVHVNHRKEMPRYGILLCANGTGILNRQIKENLMSYGRQGITYDEMTRLASQAPPGSKGLNFLPYGNSAERTLGNNNIGASHHHLNFNIHNKTDYIRSAVEGVAFALNYGMGIVKNIGMEIEKVRAGSANMFLSLLFGEIFAAVTPTTGELMQADGTQGAARGAGIGIGFYASPAEALVGLKKTGVIRPDEQLADEYQGLYSQWFNLLKTYIDME